MDTLPFTVQTPNKIDNIKVFQVNNNDYDVLVIELDRNAIDCIFLNPFYKFFIFVKPDNEMYVSKFGMPDDFKFKFTNVKIQSEDINWFLVNTIMSGIHVIISGPPDFIRYEPIMV